MKTLLSIILLTPFEQGQKIGFAVGIIIAGIVGIWYFNKRKKKNQ